MKLFFVAVCCVVSAIAQPVSNPLTHAFMGRYRAIRQNLVETANAMPEEQYSFRLTPVQRPFGEWIGHTAMGNYFFCSAVRGDARPDTSHLHRLTRKADLIDALQKSFDYCDAAFKGMTDRKALTETTVGEKKGYPVQGMVGLIASDNEHYGNLVGYLRAKGITPPSTARSQNAKK